MGGAGGEGGWKQENHKRISLVNWFQAKEDRELGLQRLKEFNLAFLMKLGWKISTNSQELWVVVLRSKYRQNVNSIIDSLKACSSSHTWNSIRKVWPLVLREVHWAVGNGQLVRFWKDIWIGESPLEDHITTQIPEEDLNKIVANYTIVSVNWDWNSTWPFLPHQLCLLIVVCKALDDHAGDDKMY